MKLVILSLLLLFIGNVLTYEPWSWANGTTTPDIETIVKGRCAQYQLLDAKAIEPELRVKVDCNKLWTIFTEPWANRSMCDLSNDAYNKAIDIMDNKKSYTDKVRGLLQCVNVLQLVSWGLPLVFCFIYFISLSFISGSIDVCKWFFSTQ